MGQIIGSDGVIAGSYWVDNQSVEIRAQLIASHSDRTLAEGSVQIAKFRIPADLHEQLIPAQPIWGEIPPSQKMQETTNPETDLRIDVWTGRGDGGICHAGEKMIVFLRSNRGSAIHVMLWCDKCR